MRREFTDTQYLNEISGEVEWEKKNMNAEKTQNSIQLPSVPTYVLYLVVNSMEF